MSRRSLPPQLRFSILSRDRFTCRYCSRSAPDVELHVDHVVAVANGGTDDPANLVAACVDCNSGKSAAEIGTVPSAPRAKAISARHPLIGYGFLSFKGGKVSEQGLITDVVEDQGRSFAVCQYFEWIMGEDTYCRLIPVSALAFDGEGQEVTYRLFRSNDARNSYYEWKGGSAGFEEGAR